MDIINPDGSINGKTFSGPNYSGEFPHPKYNQETYSQFFQRVENLKQNGFHLGDLSWTEWDIYCKGSPYNENYLQNEIIK